MKEIAYKNGSHSALWVSLLALALAAGCSDCDEGEGETPTPVPTTVEFLAPPSGSIITQDDDANAQEEGVQPLFKLRTAGVKEGEVRLSAGAQGSADPHDTVTLSVTGEELSTDALTLVEGANEITAELRSPSGALLDQSTLNLTLRLPQPPVPSIRITSPVDGAEIGPEDDRAPAVDGIQIDVLALLTDVEDGSPVVLTLNGAEVQALNAEGSNLTFGQVTVPEGEVRLVTTATTPQGDVSDDVTITVALPAEDCTVTVTPVGTGDCDFTAQDEDADPNAPGFQAEISVTTSCEQSVITVNGEDSAPLAVQGDGRLTALIDLEEGDNTLAVTARRRDGSGAVTSPTINFQVDTVAPQVGITFPEEGRLLTFQNVADEDPSDGLTVQVNGQTSGQDGEVALFVNDAQVATATPDEAGAVSFVVNFAEAGPARISLRAQDGCENPAEAGVNVVVSLDRSALAVISPEDGAVFGPLDDLDTETPGLQTTFEVEAVDIGDDTPVYVECRRLNQSVFLRRGEDVALAGGAASVAVTLPDGEYSCRARSDSPEVFSAEVAVVVSLIREEVFFTQPEEGALVNTPMIPVAARTVNVAQSTPVTLTVGAQTLSGRVRDDAIFFPNVALAEGENVLELLVQTEEAPTARRVVVLDTVAPVVSFVSPSIESATITDADDESGDLGDGFTVAVTVQVEGAYEGAAVCVSVPYSQERCGAVGADGAATIGGLELIPGEVTLTARASDAVGNEGRATLAITVTTGLPSLLITSPEDGSATTLDVINVTVTTDLAPGTAVSLYVNGAEEAADTQPTDEGGVARFEDVALVGESENTLQASGEDARGRGWSPVSRITVNTAVPEVLFVSPTDGAVLNAATPDVDGAPGFQINVTTRSAGIEDGQPAALGVECGGAAATYSATTQNEQATFARVTLTNNASCTLTVRVTNRAGTVGESSATVRVDRTPPTLRFARLLDGDVLNINDDENPEEDGLQRSVRISTAGFEAGQVVTLADDQGRINLSSAPLTAGQASVVFGPLTLPNGQLTLITAGSDTAGNPARAQVSILVDASELVISIESPQRGSTLTYVDDLSSQTPGLQAQVVASSVRALQGNPARLCSDQAPEGATPCETGGYRLLAEGAFQGELAGITFNVTLPEGAQNLLVESRLVEDDQLVVSPVVTVTVDTVRPEIVGFTLLSDSLAPVGVVGIAEDGNPNQPGFLGRFRIQTRGLATGNPVRIFDAANPAVALAGSPLGLTDTVELDLRLAQEREYALFANAFDAANNDVASPPVLRFRVDLTAPTLAISNLTNGQVLNSMDDADAQRAGLQYAVNGLSDEVGAQVQLWAVTGALDPFGAPVDDVPLATATVAEGGTYDFGADVQIPEGTWTLAVRVADEAGNNTTQTARVTVDVTAPTIDIRTPASGASLTQEDPAFLARPGFQVAVTVQSDSRNLPVAIYPVGGDSPVSDPVTLNQSGRATLILTLGRGLNTLEARVTDALGNTGRSEPHELNIDIQGCGITFTQPTAQTVRVSQDDDEDPNNGTVLDFEAVVADVQSCLGQPVGLFANDAEVASQTLTEEGIVRFTGVRFPNASTSVVLAQVSDAQGNLSATSAVTVLVDLIPPTIAFVTPAGPTQSYGIAQDVGGAPGLQTTVTVQVTNATGGFVSVSSSLAGEPVAVDVPVQGGTVTMTNLTFPEGEQTVTATVTDRVGSSAQAQVTFHVDLTRPATVAVASEVINPRLGAVDLSWSAPGDDGAVGTAARYEVRLSDAPIANMADFMAADLVDTVDAVAPGQPVSFSLEQLPWNPPLDVPGVTWHLAVAAFDEVGNASTLGDNVTVSLGLREARLSASTSAGAFGFKTFPIGDVNNDGFADLSVFGNSVGGASYILYGGDDASLEGRDNTPDAVQRLTVPQADAFPLFGAVATGLGDINGDQIDDFAVSSYFFNGGDGKVYIYFGVDGGQVADVPNVIINAPPRAIPRERAYLGISLGVATNFSDVADEGLPDLIIGAYGENAFIGSAYVVLGRTTWPPTISLSNGDDRAQGVIRMEGRYAGGSFGYMVQGLSDVDDDGFSELAVSAYYANAQDGAVSVFSGGPIGDVAGGVLTALNDASELMKFVDGGQFGGAMAVADLNADGVLELVAGAYAGNDAVGIFDFSNGIPTQASRSWAAPQPNQLMGEQIALVDINGDTMPDVVLGGNITQGSTGRIDIYLNDDGNFSGVPPQIRYIRGEKWGNDVTAIGDFNGDGYEDLAVSLSENGTGAVVILY